MIPQHTTVTTWLPTAANGVQAVRIFMKFSQNREAALCREKIVLLPDFISLSLSTVCAALSLRLLRTAHLAEQTRRTNDRLELSGRGPIISICRKTCCAE